VLVRTVTLGSAIGIATPRLRRDHDLSYRADRHLCDCGCRYRCSGCCVVELRPESLFRVSLGVLGAGALGGGAVGGGAGCGSGALGGGLDGSGLSGFKSCALTVTTEAQTDKAKAKVKNSLAARGDLIFIVRPPLRLEGLNGKSVSALYAHSVTAPAFWGMISIETSYRARVRCSGSDGEVPGISRLVKAIAGLRPL
jgi:hypothetical protein